jgi:PAS domain S-box-containing protein
MPSSDPLPRLLIVDDEEGLLFLMTEALRREGYQVDGVESGAEALEWLRSHSPDLLLLDLKLGDIAAPVLVERLRQQGHEFPFLIITGHGDERTVVELMKQGALDYVMKDKGLLELLPSVVRRALSAVERERRLSEANEGIRHREERHRKIIQTALDGFARFNNEGRFLEVNESLCKLLGYTREELLLMNASAVETHGAPCGLMECIQGAQSEATRCSSRLRRRDGAVLDVELSLRREGDEVFGFAHDVTQQRRLEREVLEISEDERRRFGRDLHDGLGQQLTALEMMSHTLARELKTAAPALAASATEISTFTRAAVVQARQLAHGLAPVALEAEGLMRALNDLAILTSRTGVACEFQCDSPVGLHDSAAATHLYRIAQESVNNALKYAKAAGITVRLQDAAESIHLTIEDNGCGLPAEKPGKCGMGLAVMEYRARLIGGRLDVRSEPGKGVRITCAVPKR